MFRNVVVLCGIIGLVAGANSAVADIMAIDVATLLGASSSYSGGTLTYTGGAGAIAYLDSGDEISFPGASVTASFGNLSDNSTGGVASGRFGTGTWTVNMTDSGSTVLTMSGHITWYDELELTPQALHGRGITYVDSFWADSTYFQNVWGLEDAPIWSGGLGVANGITSETTGISVDPLLNYNVPFTASNVTVTVWADPSNIPEPATLALIISGFGLVCLGRRRIGRA
jgi:hypothetical protein